MDRIRYLNMKKMLFAVFSVSLYFNSYMCLSWSSFQGGRYILLVSVIGTIGAFIPFVFCFVRKRKLYQVSLPPIFLIIMIVLYQSIGGINSAGFSIGRIGTIVFVVSLFMLKDEENTNIFQLVLKIFVLMMLPGLLYYIICISGIELPALFTFNRSDIAVNMGGSYYKAYPLGLILFSGGIPRLCGLFDEPGYVGTLAALFIAAGYEKVDKKWLILLGVIGGLSFSSAFYLLTVLFIITKSFQKGALKITIAMIVITVTYFLIINLQTGNTVITFLQYKLSFDGFFQRRVTSAFRFVYEEFVNNGGITLLFGMGHYQAMKLQTEAYTYKMLIYDYGIVGTILYLGFFGAVLVYKKNVMDNLPFLIVFFVSIYQRPYVLNYFMITLFITVLSYKSEDKYII